jgi:hypothetical protein
MALGCQYIIPSTKYLPPVICRAEGRQIKKLDDKNQNLPWLVRSAVTFEVINRMYGKMS